MKIRISKGFKKKVFLWSLVLSNLTSSSCEYKNLEDLKQEEIIIDEGLEKLTLKQIEAIYKLEISKEEKNQELNKKDYSIISEMIQTGKISYDEIYSITNNPFIGEKLYEDNIILFEKYIKVNKFTLRVIESYIKKNKIDMEKYPDIVEDMEAQTNIYLKEKDDEIYLNEKYISFFEKEGDLKILLNAYNFNDNYYKYLKYIDINILKNNNLLLTKELINDVTLIHIATNYPEIFEEKYKEIFKEYIYNFDKKIERIKKFNETSDFKALLSPKAIAILFEKNVNGNFNVLKSGKEIYDIIESTKTTMPGFATYLNYLTKEVYQEKQYANINIKYIGADNIHNFILIPEKKYNPKLVYDFYLYNFKTTDEISKFIDEAEENFASSYKVKYLRTVLEITKENENLFYERDQKLLKIIEDNIKNYFTGKLAISYIKYMSTTDDQKAEDLFEAYKNNIITVSDIAYELEYYEEVTSKFYLKIIEEKQKHITNDDELVNNILTEFESEEQDYLSTFLYTCIEYKKNPKFYPNIGYTDDMINEILANNPVQEDFYWMDIKYINKIVGIKLETDTIKRMMLNNPTNFSNYIDESSEYYEFIKQYDNFILTMDISKLNKEYVSESDIRIALNINVHNYEYIQNNLSSICISEDIINMLDVLANMEKEELKYSTEYLDKRIEELKKENNNFVINEPIVLSQYAEDVFEYVIDDEIIEFLNEEVFYANYKNHSKFSEIILLKIANYYNIPMTNVDVSNIYMHYSSYETLENGRLSNGSYMPNSKDISLDGINNVFYSRLTFMDISVHEFFHYMQFLAYNEEIPALEEEKAIYNVQMEESYGMRDIEYYAWIEGMQLVYFYFDDKDYNFYDAKENDERIERAEEVFKNLVLTPGHNFNYQTLDIEN